MSTITIGIFESGEDAQRAISQLVETGVEQGDLHPIRRQQHASDGQGVLGSLFRAVGFGAGGVSNELTRLGVDQEEAAFYEEALGGRQRPAGGGSVRRESGRRDGDHAQGERHLPRVVAPRGDTGPTREPSIGGTIAACHPRRSPTF
ncbi:MAG: hypothetical protein U5J97_02685 [Trueperaceae bacterium]|nr:hypothetical protein [Trueperaceae bacterium]